MTFRTHFSMFLLPVALLIADTSQAQSELSKRAVSEIDSTYNLDLDPNQRVRLAKAMDDRQINKCQLEDWIKQLTTQIANEKLSSDKVMSDLSLEIREFENRYAAVKKELEKMFDITSTEIEDWARGIARDNEYKAIYEKVIPEIKTQLQSQGQLFNDNLQKIKKLHSVYQNRTETVCEKLQREIEENKRKIEQMQNSNQHFKVPLDGGTETIPVPQTRTRLVHGPPAIQVVNHRQMFAAKATLVHKCYDYYPDGQGKGFIHGDLYFDGQQYFLWHHTKTKW